MCSIHIYNKDINNFGVIVVFMWRSQNIYFFSHLSCTDLNYVNNFQIYNSVICSLQLFTASILVYKCTIKKTDRRPFAVISIVKRPWQLHQQSQDSYPQSQNNYPQSQGNNPLSQDNYSQSQDNYPYSQDNN